MYTASDKDSNKLLGKKMENGLFSIEIIIEQLTKELVFKLMAIILFTCSGKKAITFTSTILEARMLWTLSNSHKNKRNLSLGR